MVITLEDSICFGGHFYSLETMEETLQSIVDEHYHGKSTTNAEHPRAYLSMIQYVLQLSVRFGKDEQAESEYIPPDKRA